MQNSQALEQLVHELEMSGWQRKFVVARERLNEVIELYIDQGYAVCILPGFPAPPTRAESICHECWHKMCETCYLIFTRKTPSLAE